MNEVGSVASILSFFLTLWVMYEVRTLRAYYKRHLVLPRLLASLQNNLKNAQAALKDKRMEDAKDSLHNCDAIAERIGPHVDKTAKSRIASARGGIKKALENGDQQLITSAHETVRSISAAIESITAFTGEDKWKT